MPDREKVIKGLEMCANSKCGNKCPYNVINYGCRSKLELDALTLLKEQEKEIKMLNAVPHWIINDRR